jgi:sirohydrochlorin ferrochelatase
VSDGGARQVNHAWSKSPSAETRVCEEGTDGEAARLADTPAVGSTRAVVSVSEKPSGADKG